MLHRKTDNNPLYIRIYFILLWKRDCQPAGEFGMLEKQNRRDALHLKLATIHQYLGEQRRKQNLAQRDVAEALNVEQATISFYETGKRSIPLDLLDRWLQLLEIEKTRRKI